MRKILNILLWVLLPLLVVIAGIFAQNNYNKRKVKTLNIDIDYQQKGDVNQFLTYADINAFVDRQNDSICNKSVGSVNIESIEKSLNSIPYVLHADAVLSLSGELNLRIKQRRALVRIIDLSGEEFYLDEQARILPLKPFFPSRVIICNGMIKSPKLYAKEYNETQLDSIVQNSSLKDIYEMAKYIDADTMLRNQIVQMNMDEKGNFKLVPLVSNHIIEFGKAENIDEKFSKLKVFYTKGLGKHRWNKYKVLNLKYKNQIVCTKI